MAVACTKVDDCSCRTLDGQEVNIRSLGYQGSQAPRFTFQPPQGTAEPWQYAFNPCYTFTYDTTCSNVIACQRSTQDPTETYNIGDVTSTWSILNEDYLVSYSHLDNLGTTRTSQVTLKCDPSAEEPTLDRLGTEGGFGTTYFFTLTSKCACPGVCGSTPPQTTAKPPQPPGSGGLSPGSVLCILFSVFVTVYIIGGALFMKYVRHAEGTDVIPNKDLWTNLPGYIKDGILFVTSCGKKTGYDSQS
ncbi:uncharacterized protein [Asterias amurensis]|uniref:uncharacterized protein isoform X2 n=1 Tax=Asterias amurensis TaxID=7602 RepID=UPI003AB81C09